MLPASKPQRGYTYTHEVIEDVPWSIHLVKLDLSAQGF